MPFTLAIPVPTPTQQASAYPTNRPTPTNTPLHTPTPSPTPTPTITTVPALTVLLVLESHSQFVQIGQEFELAVKVGAGHTKPVDTAQVYLDFDPTVLEVETIRPGPHLEHQLQSSWDPDRGRLAYAAGTLRNPLEFPFTLCTVVLRVKARPIFGSTLIQFDDLKPPHQSKAIYRGLNVTGELAPVRISVP